MTVLAAFPSLARAYVVSSRNHFTDSIGGSRRLVALLVAVVVALGVFDVFTYRALNAFLGDLLAAPEVSGRILPMLPVLLAVPSFAISLIVAMVMPVASPLALQARIAGVSRWVCGIAEFAPSSAVTVLIACAAQGGSVAFLAGSSSPATAASLGLLFLNAAFALLCPVFVLSIQRALGLLRVPAYESRWLAVLAATVLAGAGLLDLMRWASGPDPAGRAPSTLAHVSRLWDGAIPDTISACVTLLGCLVVLFGLGCLLAASDTAGGYLSGGRPLFHLPAIGGSAVQLVGTEVAQWLRDPTARVSLACTLAGDAAVIWAVRTQALDSGIGLVIVILLSASGAELLVGRTLPGNWLLQTSAVGFRTIVCLRYGPVLGIMSVFFLGTLVASGASDGDPLRIVEALSLAAAVTSAAVLAGTLFPFDPRAPLAMVGTTVVAFLLEIALLVVITGVLRLEGWRMVLADGCFVVLCVPLVLLAFRSALRRGV